MTRPLGDYEEVMNKASCLGLLSNAAVLWNTVQIEHVVGRLAEALPVSMRRSFHTAFVDAVAL